MSRSIFDLTGAWTKVRGDGNGLQFRCVCVSFCPNMLARQADAEESYDCTLEIGGLRRGLGESWGVGGPTHPTPGGL